MKFLIFIFALLFTLGFILSSLALNVKDNIYYHNVYPPNPYPTNDPPTNGPTDAPTNTPSNVSTSPTPNDSTNISTDGTVTPSTGSSATPPTDGSATPPTDGSATPPTDGSATPPTDGSATPPTDGPETTPADGPATPSTDTPTNPPTSPPNNFCDQSGGNRIIGGTDAPAGAYPYQVSIRSSKDNQHFCGGSIISNRWILTAAHCVIGATAADMYIVTGTNLLNSGGTSYAAEQIVMHPAFDNVNAINDYALIKVKSAIAFGPTVTTIPLATERPPVGSNALATGWGFTNSAVDQVSNNLQRLCVRVISNDVCQNTWPEINNSVVCTFNREGEGMCRGDSGGPLVWNNRQFGIVSFGPRVCASGFPDAFASVPEEFLWIQGITGINK